jgi:hypothetical protein
VATAPARDLAFSRQTTGMALSTTARAGSTPGAPAAAPRDPNFKPTSAQGITAPPRGTPILPTSKTSDPTKPAAPLSHASERTARRSIISRVFGAR